MSSALVVGGSSGIGLSLAINLAKEDYEKVYILDKQEPIEHLEKFTFLKLNLINGNFDILNQFYDEIDSVFITAGIGRLDFFENIESLEIENDFKINTFPTIKIINMFYQKLKSKKRFRFVVLTSIAGLVSSPLYALYSATKSALCGFISSVNAELEYQGSPNRILNVAPGHVSGTAFHGGTTNIRDLDELSKTIISYANQRKELLIPKYDEIYKKVLSDNFYNQNQFAINSLKYKLENNKLELKRKYKIGYLSGTFDLFHIGHLNLLERAKDYCDFLIVGVHKDGSHKGKDVAIPFEERKKIIASIKYVDKVITSLYEDSDVYEIEKYDYLFVGSDYKGSERFNNYEKILIPKGVKIIYFPYTEGTNSTQLRQYINSK